MDGMLTEQSLRPEEQEARMRAYQAIIQPYLRIKMNIYSIYLPEIFVRGGIAEQGHTLLKEAQDVLDLCDLAIERIKRSLFP
jgi:hypothetical protein